MLLRDFRQGERVGRNPRSTGKTPGRSRWPEPEAVRRATKMRLGKHAPLEGVPNNVYPRAEFGLPIVFHFKNNDKGEPKDTELIPLIDGEPKQRMASPVILKPLAIGADKAVSMILHLKASGVCDVGLNRVTPRGHIENAKVRDPRRELSELAHGVARARATEEIALRLCRGGVPGLCRRTRFPGGLSYEWVSLGCVSGSRPGLHCPRHGRRETLGSDRTFSPKSAKRQPRRYRSAVGR